MEKPAPVDHPVHELVRRRWSPRAFADRPVDADTLRVLLEAARWAPSSFNEQPWTFIVATRDDREGFEALLDVLASGNQGWAQTAPVLMLSVARQAFARNDKPNRHALHDVGLASAQMALQATALGLGLHMMAGFDRDRARATFAIPDGFEAVAAIAVGYPLPLEAMTDEQRARAEKPRTRKALSEFVFAGTWGRPAGVA